MLFKEDCKCRDAQCNVHSRATIAIDGITRQLSNFLGLSVSWIAPNTWRIFIGVEILWGHLSGGNCQLLLDEFFYCYKPQHIVSSQGIYHFAARKKALRLVSDMPDSNKNWKGRYFFVQGTDWVCRLEEWVTMPHGFDNTWGIVKDLGLAPSVFTLTFPIYLLSVFGVVFLFQLVFVQI